MSSSGSVCGDLFGGKPAQTSQALTLRDFTMARTSSALQAVGDTDVEKFTPEKHIVKAPAWLSYMYSELHREIEHLGNIILELQTGTEPSSHRSEYLRHLRTGPPVPTAALRVRFAKATRCGPRRLPSV